MTDHVPFILNRIADKAKKMGVHREETPGRAELILRHPEMMNVFTLAGVACNGVIPEHRDTAAQEGAHRLREFMAVFAATCEYLVDFGRISGVVDPVAARVGAGVEYILHGTLPTPE